jgi:hypothetical protein
MMMPTRIADHATARRDRRGPQPAPGFGGGAVQDVAIAQECRRPAYYRLEGMPAL